MAKQLVGPLERHLEKAVVAVAGLLLVGAVGMYLITSPNQITINGTLVPPSKISDELVATSRAVRDRVVGVRSEVQAPPPVFDDFESLIEPFSEAKLGDLYAGAVAFGPSIPIIDPPTAVDGDKELVKVVALNKPITTSGRSTVVMYDNDNDTYGEAINWAVVSLVFDREKQSKRQASAYGGSRKEVTFGPVELQRRAQRPGGIWNDDDWELVNAWPAKTVPTPPKFSIIEQEGQYDVPREQHAVLTDYFRALGTPETQLEMLRPLGLEVVNGSPWAWPELVPHRELLVQDSDMLQPGEDPDDNPEDRYGGEAEHVAQAFAVRGEEQTFDEKVEEGFKLLAEARQSRDLNQATTAYNVCFGVSADIRASGRAKSLAKQCMSKAEQLEDDIKRQIDVRKPTRRPVVSDDEDDYAPIDRYPRQQIWVIDANADSIAPGYSYQYRMRVSIYNRLVAEPSKFANPDDAKIVFLKSEWSEPTDPIVYEAVSHMFATSFDHRSEKISLEVFQWFFGEWVKGRERFGVGDKMSFQTRATTRATDDPTKAVKALVNFEIDGTVVDIDFARAYRTKKKGLTRDGVKLGVVGKECSIIYVDSSGELHERFVPFDKKHPFKGELGSRVWKPGRDTGK
ncbi:hypothetical protein JYU10_00410 [bacterium AH-315-J04]|nr:hypothetical protein [bacterium AH-315-J04]